MHIEHIAVWTNDLERLKSFYEKYFDACAGDKYTNRKKEFESYFLEFTTGARLELMSMPGIAENRTDEDRRSTGFVHLAFSTGSSEQVDALTGRLRRDGYTVADGPRRTGDGYYESVVLDPDGNRIEITI